MIKRNKITLKEIAELLGVTTATVSKALRDSPDISERTRNKVKKIASEMGYRPNILARTLIQRRSYILGVIIPDLRISFFSEATRGIYEQARLRDYETILMVHDENPEVERKNLLFLSDLHVDGILLNAAAGIYNYNVYHKLIAEGIPIVCYDRKLDDFDFPSVTIDDQEAAFKLTSEMIDAGRKRIIFLGPHRGISVAKERYQGYFNALLYHHIDFNPDFVIDTDLSRDDGYEKMELALKNGIKPDGVICVGALTAYGAGNAILKSRLSIPSDIMLGEFGDNDVNTRLGVPFLTINQNPYEIGKRAVDLLIDNIETDKKNNPAEHILIETKLIHR
ncbi:LacI family DNA-binding transcriptional regulator [bacterium]|nr:LacI family DNA-binding transcriptional regulator [bacterium]RQV96511.1 MAG: LacI family transcriptional regulator [bacterium]